jgi:hypothetical protein
MKVRKTAAMVMVAGLALAVPAFAQTSPTTSTQKQRTDGGDSPANKQTDQSAAAWHKQHTDGGDSPANMQTDKTASAWHKQHTDGGDSPANKQTDQSAAAWHKQHTQSLSHSDGSPSGVMKQN